MRSDGHQLGLITNGASLVQRAKIRGSRLEGMFDAVVVSGEFNVAKPDPAVFHAVLDELGFFPHRYGEVLVVGDHLVNDVFGAQRLGMAAAWVNRRGLPPKWVGEPAAYTVSELGDLRR